MIFNICMGMGVRMVDCLEGGEVLNLLYLIGGER